MSKGGSLKLSLSTSYGSPMDYKQQYSSQNQSDEEDEIVARTEDETWSVCPYQRYFARCTDEAIPTNFRDLINKRDASNINKNPLTIPKQNPFTYKNPNYSLESLSETNSPMTPSHLGFDNSYSIPQEDPTTDNFKFISASDISYNNNEFDIVPYKDIYNKKLPFKYEKRLPIKQKSPHLNLSINVHQALNDQANKNYID